jgi:hypothetical protein
MLAPAPTSSAAVSSAGLFAKTCFSVVDRLTRRSDLNVVPFDVLPTGS